MLDKSCIHPYNTFYVITLQGNTLRTCELCGMVWDVESPTKSLNGNTVAFPSFDDIRSRSSIKDFKIPAASMLTRRPLRSDISRETFEVVVA